MAGQKNSHRTHFTIDNNFDNNPQRHRWTQDDTPHGKIQENSDLVDVYGHWWTERGELQNRRLQVRFLSHLPLNSGFVCDTHCRSFSFDLVSSKMAPSRPPTVRRASGRRRGISTSSCPAWHSVLALVAPCAGASRPERPPTHEGANRHRISRT